MSDRFSRRWALCLILVLLLSPAVGCGVRPVETDVSERALPTESPEPVQEERFTVEFWNGETLLDRQSVAAGSLPDIPVLEGVRLLGWKDENGESAWPEESSVTADAKYYALVRPLLVESAAFLFADEHGLLRPEDLFTRADAALALRALCPEEAESIFPMPDADTADEPMLRTEFLELLYRLFDPEVAEILMKSICPYESDTLTRGIAANVISGLLGPIEVPENAYYPDAGLYIWGRDALLRAAGSSQLTPETLTQEAKDGFFWIDGYLYALDEDGYFRTEEYNGLTFDGNGRFTSGDKTLDRYVAETLVEYMKPEQPRLEDLRAVYYHVKNDFQYLTRNYYASGENGWENAEALTLFETGKGNCYCYAGVFRSLARGLGYNAVCYSGTMGNQDQPHAWTEIIMEDGRVYICDPEIEMNYWWVAAMKNDPSMYTDNFMMPIESSAGWNYQAVGR